MQKGQAVLAVAICVGTLFVQGCEVALVGAGAGTVAYLKGDLEAMFEEGPQPGARSCLEGVGQA